VPQADPRAGVPLTMEASGSDRGTSGARSEGAAAADVVDDVTAKEATTKKRVADVVAAEKTTAIKAATKKAATDKAAADKTATEKATTDTTTADKVAVDKAVTEKATTDRATMNKAIMDERATEEAAAKKTVMAGATETYVMESVDSGSTLALAAGSKRAATPSDSTPPQKQFHGAWKQ
jgi:hypothetical protein